MRHRSLPRAAVAAALAGTLAITLSAQGGRGTSANLQQAQQALRDGRGKDAVAAARLELGANPASTQAANLLDLLGMTADARTAFKRAIDAASDPAAKATTQRAMAVSYAFDGDCTNAIKFEQMALDYWVTRETAEPQKAFYQEGEVANEAARICIDAGKLDQADTWYRKGYDLGMKEPAPKTHPKSLWDFRLAHALGRLAARRGNAAEAQKQIAAARQALDSDPAMAALQQERFFPYLVGYVALYTNDLAKAETELKKTTEMTGNTTDPFMLCLLGMTYEKAGKKAEATATYQKVLGLATNHNPPSAFARPFVRKKLGLSIPS